MAANDREIPGPSRKPKLSGESVVDLQDVVKILVEDNSLTTNWKRFCYSLQQSSLFDQWERSLNKNEMTIDGIVIEILSNCVMVRGKEATVGRLYAALITEEFKEVAGTLTAEYDLSCTIVQMPDITRSNQSETTNSDTPIAFDLFKPTDNFVGRTKELAILETFLQQRKQLLVVSGSSGVGKSELLRKFGVKFVDDKRGSCVWIHGDGEDSFKNSIKRLVEYVSLNLEPDADPVDNFVEVCNVKLKKWQLLIILDNIDECAGLVEKFIQYCKSLPYNIPLIIVTSRNKYVLANAEENVELEMLNPDEAVKMVTNRLGSCVSGNDAIKLCDSLRHFPMVVQQAISFISHKRCHSLGRNFGVSEYLELFDKEKAKYPLSPYNYNSLPTFATWRVILDEIERMNDSISLLALDILRMTPYFNANGVPLSILTKYYQDINWPCNHESVIDSEQSKLESEEIEMAVLLIQAFSMCRVDGDNTIASKNLNISFHRLVRDFMLSNSNTEMDKEILRRLYLACVDEMYSDKQNVKNLGQTHNSNVLQIRCCDDEDSVLLRRHL